MLGKLVKYDMKRQIRLLLAVYLVVGLTAGFSAIFRVVKTHFEDTTGVLKVVSGLTTGMAILTAVVMVAGTFIYAVLYFRKNLFKDEGYLMHTLPVKPWQLYVSKLAVGTLYCYLSILVAAAAMCLAFLYIPNLSDLISGAMAAGVPEWFFAVMVVTIALSIPTSLIQFYVSLAFGYTVQTNTRTPVNKDLMSVISYIVLYMAQQVISLGIILVWAVANIGKIADSNMIDSFDMAGAQTFNEMFEMMGGIYAISIVLMLLLSAGLSVLSVWRMQKHLNLS